MCDGIKRNIDIIKINRKKGTKRDKSDSVVERMMNHQFSFVMNHPSATAFCWRARLARYSPLWQLYLLRCSANLCFVVQSNAISLFL